MKLVNPISTRTLQCILMPMILFGVLNSVHADDIQKQIDFLRQQLYEVQKDTDDMKNDLDELKVENQDWLTQERAEQIRLLVQDVMIDADSRSSLMGDGLLGGWSNGFFLASSDGRFKLNIGGVVQERYVLNYARVGLSPATDRWRGGLENTRTRLNISGHIFDRDTTFLFQPGFGWLDPNAIEDQPNLRIGARFWDAWVKFRLTDQWSAKVGVFMLPFTRESLVSDTRQMAVDRSLLDYRVGLARSQGVEFTWVGEGKRVFLSTTNGSAALRGLVAGADNPTPPWGALTQATDWSFTGRVEYLLEGRWSQFKQFTSPVGSEPASMFGFAMHAQIEDRTGSGGRKTDQWGLSADLSLNFDGASLFFSGTFQNQKFIFNNVPNTDWLCYVFQGSVYASDNTEFFMRYEGGGPMQDPLGNNTVHILTSGMNWYLEDQQFKVTSDFGWSFGEIQTVNANQMVGWRGSVNRNAEWLFRTQLQLEF